jgi:hypothetical protein
LKRSCCRWTFIFCSSLKCQTTKWRTTKCQTKNVEWQNAKQKSVKWQNAKQKSVKWQNAKQKMSNDKMPNKKVSNEKMTNKKMSNDLSMTELQNILDICTRDFPAVSFEYIYRPHVSTEFENSFCLRDPKETFFHETNEILFRSSFCFHACWKH